ncbi:SCO family protein [Nocardiopsis sp. JB363]|uniref:SCO family protein n=1 Tax=Nocardiopsis sp. JB363 TaxID=1434837 RepID=UPI00097AEB81|nr:SCO family protein [Nocardiopsis sp. JB363]SIO84463.1 Cytochrome oxidase biogenesis protein Sco1/SenC/PrrC, putative copper metallochaperone [Nocardiopsis sp. JB363]
MNEPVTARFAPARLWRPVGAAVAATVLLSGVACSAGGGLDEVEHYLDLSDEPMAASQVELAAVDGEPWRFTDVDPDRLTLLFFGYTSCPDVCPMTMAEIDLALEEAGPVAEDVDVVMVTSDPARDTDEQLRSWLDRFDPGFQGVRGEIEDIVTAAGDYGIPIEAPQETEGDYLVSHGGRIIVLTGGGEAAGMFDEGVEADQVADLLPVLAEELL